MYVKNQYGEYDLSQDVYLNDKNICELFNGYQLMHKKKYKQYNDRHHGTIGMENKKMIDMGEKTHEQDMGEKTHEPNDSKYYLHGVDMIKGVFCDVNFEVNFGEYVIKQNLSIDESKSYQGIGIARDQLINSPGDQYDKYRFSVKMYQIESDPMTEFVIEQFEVNKKASDRSRLGEAREHKLKNRIEYRGSFYEILDKIKKCVSEIYQAYNMPLD